MISDFLVEKNEKVIFLFIIVMTVSDIKIFEMIKISFAVFLAFACNVFYNTKWASWFSIELL